MGGVAGGVVGGNVTGSTTTEGTGAISTSTLSHEESVVVLACWSVAATASAWLRLAVMIRASTLTLPAVTLSVACII